MSALVFFIIANPDTFRITRRLFGKWISSPTGCPTGKGLMFHTLVFLLVTWGMMNIRREGFEMIESEPSPSTMQIIPEDAILVEEKPIKPSPSPSPSPSVAPSAAPSSMMEIVPPPMVDMPLPLPDMSETQFSPMDSGLSLGAFDITSVPDSALPGEFNNAETVTCQCSNGKSITMN